MLRVASDTNIKHRGHHKWDITHIKELTFSWQESYHSIQLEGFVASSLLKDERILNQNTLSYVDEV